MSPILLTSPTQKPPSHTKGALLFPTRGRVARRPEGAHSRWSAARRWYVPGASLACFWCQAGNRLAPWFPAPSTAARGVSPLASPSSRAASPPPDAQSAVRHADGLPALALSTAQRLATGCCRPSASAHAVESDVAGTVPARARPTSLQPRCTLASFARQGSPGTSRKLFAVRKLSRKFRSFPLDSRCRGGARMASRAKARRARRKNSAYARAAFAR